MAQINEICEILKNMNDTQLDTAKKLLQTIALSNVAKVHILNGGNLYYSNIPPECLQITKNDPKLAKIDDMPDGLPYYTEITNLVGKYYLENCEHVTNISPDYVLKTNSEVLIRSGDKVVYNQLIFYARHLGTVTKLYATKKDYDYDKNYVAVVTTLICKLVHIDNLENEINARNKMCAIWNASRNDISNDSHSSTCSETD